MMCVSQRSDGRRSRRTVNVIAAVRRKAVGYFNSSTMLAVYVWSSRSNPGLGIASYS